MARYGWKVLVGLFAVMRTPSTAAKMHKITPDSSPSLSEVMKLTEPGDVVELGDGVYKEGIVTSRGGTMDSPILIVGTSNAIVSGRVDDRVVTIKHDYIHLKGFTVDGNLGGDAEEHYAEKCIFVHGHEEPKDISYKGHELLSSINGLVIRGMSIRNCLGECIRLKYFVTHADIQDNQITNCGVQDFVFTTGAQGKNGEGIYIGTSSLQWGDGRNPDSRPDGCNFNLVKNNRLTTNGNECVEVKEGAEQNVIEGNTCSDQRDKDAGCYGSRGDNNTFRYNTGDSCLGAGIRLGGHQGFGIGNRVYKNSFDHPGAGALKIKAFPQETICGNQCQGSECSIIGDEGSLATWDQPCDTELGTQVELAGGALDPVEDEASVDDDEEEEDGTEEDGDDDSDNVGDDNLVDDNNSAPPGHEDANSQYPRACWDVQINPGDLEASGEVTQDENPVTNVLDGNLNTRWSAEGQGSWLSVSLGKLTPIAGLFVSFYKGTQRTQTFEVTDGEGDVS
ncbi:unnamed protein product, partial [Discosporangium mesarthrocarpum]